MNPKRRKDRGRVALKAGLAIVVLGFVGRHAVRTWRDLGSRGLAPRLDPAWLALATGLYVAGLIAFGVVFRKVLEAGPTRVGPFASIRAYVISHLGKYVPGKALVVVIRVALVAPSGARVAPATLATLHETLAMMACGAVLASVIFGLEAVAGLGPGSMLDLGVWWGRSVAVPPWLLGLGLAGPLVAVAWPSVFGRLAGLRAGRARVDPADLPRVSATVAAGVLVWATLGWTLLGLSQVAVIRGVVPSGLAPPSWPLAVASVALATVAGFAVPIAPGGLGIREWVLWTSLASALDRDLAVVAALLLRVVWFVGEVGAAAALIGWKPRAERGIAR